MENNRISFEMYLNTGIRNLLTTACRTAVSNPKELLFVLNMKKVFTRSEKRRQALRLPVTCRVQAVTLGLLPLLGI
jgi:hypothetical protein